VGGADLLKQIRDNCGYIIKANNSRPLGNEQILCYVIIKIGKSIAFL
jgi:hypothetical protein